MTRKAVADVYGAVSIVNAIATGRGAAMGISLRTSATAEASPGKGIEVEGDGSLSRALVEGTIRKTVLERDLAENRIRLSVKSEIPAGYGLKSSSSVSSAVALACAGLFRPGCKDRDILLAGVEASVEAGVSITGAYDDACGCYFGGFVVTDNLERRLVSRRRIPGNVAAVIFIPRPARRKNPKRLREYRGALGAAWKMASSSDYWNAMTLNGLAAGPPLGSDTTLVSRLLEAGALGASVSGNGPAVAAAVRGRDISGVKAVFESMDGRVIVSKANNGRARIRAVQD